MENRRTIRNWDAFGRIYRFAARMMAAEMVEPVLKLVFDISAALLLAVTFVFQTLSVLVAFDVVVVGFYHVFCTQMCKLMSALLFFSSNEREKNAAMSAMIHFFSNVLWVRLMYTVHKDCWVYMAGGPLFCIALMHTLVCLYTERLSTEQSALTQITYSLFLLSLFLMVFNTISGAPDHILMETVFLLRTAIDTLCNAVDTIFKLFDSVLSLDNNMPVYTTQIARYSFWTSVHLLQFLLALTGDRNEEPSRRGDRVLYFSLFMHELLDLMVPVKQMLTHIRHERIIAKTFPRISAIELSSLSDETCSVCLSQHNPETVRLRCNHLLHTQCLHRILQQNAESHSGQPSRCPMCRATIELPREEGQRGGLFGAGTRGARNSTRTTTFNHPLFNYIVGDQNGSGAGGGNNALAYSADGTGVARAGNAQDLIAEHLGQHNLQQGDVIHIRIIPRRARQQLAAAAATAAATAAGGTRAGAATATAPTAASAAQPLVEDPVQQVELTAAEEADLLSALQGIHAHGLHSESESNSAAASTAASSVTTSAHPSSSQLPSRPSQSNVSLVRLNSRDRRESSSTLRTLLDSLVQSGHMAAGARINTTSAVPSFSAAGSTTTAGSTPMDVVSEPPVSSVRENTTEHNAECTTEEGLLKEDNYFAEEEWLLDENQDQDQTFPSTREGDMSNGPFSVSSSDEDIGSVSESESESDGESEEEEEEEEGEDGSYVSTAHSSDSEDHQQQQQAESRDRGELFAADVAELAQILHEDIQHPAFLSCTEECADEPDVTLPNLTVGHKRGRVEAELTKTLPPIPSTQKSSTSAAAYAACGGGEFNKEVEPVQVSAGVAAEVVDTAAQGSSSAAARSEDSQSPPKRQKVVSISVAEAGAEGTGTQADYSYGCTQCSPGNSDDEEEE